MIKTLIDPKVWRKAEREGRKAGLQAGLEEGRQVGLQEGRQVGLQEGRQVGLQEGRQVGLQEGKKEGRLEGRLEGKMEVARNLFRLGADPALIVQATGISAAELERLQGESEKPSHTE